MFQKTKNFIMNLFENLSEKVLKISCDVGGPLLALDTSTSSVGLALVCAKRNICISQTMPSSMQVSERMLPALQVLLQDNHVTVSELKALCVGLGPGSFTGLRVGLAAVKGLAYGASVPVVGVSSMAVAAASVGTRSINKPVAVILNARCDEAYVAMYRFDVSGSATCLYEETVVSWPLEASHAFSKLICDHACVVVSEFENTLPVLVPTQIVLLAQEALLQKNYLDVETFVPLYGKDIMRA